MEIDQPDALPSKSHSQTLFPDKKRKADEEADETVSSSDSDSELLVCSSCRDSNRALIDRSINEWMNTHSFEVSSSIMQATDAYLREFGPKFYALEHKRFELEQAKKDAGFAKKSVRK